MGKTIVQKIFEKHSTQEATVGEIIDIEIDARVARDFGGANVVKNIEENNLSVDDASKTFFTFDCNPGGCDQKYAANQHICRLFARRNNIKIYDIDQGIGTHIAIEDGLIEPGGTIVSTDSHANILGAIGAFGQGMGDKDIAHAWTHGKIWFKVPATVKIVLKGLPSDEATAKDVVLTMLDHLGANGLLGYATEIYGEYVDSLSLDGRITIASMATEMGGIIIFFPPNDAVRDFYKDQVGISIDPVYADDDADYEKTIEIDIDGIRPKISLPGHPEDVVDVDRVGSIPVDSGIVASCTNGRIEDMAVVAEILKNKKIAPGRILKIVPATDNVWKECLNRGYIEIFKNAGALIGTAGCAGCAAGQIGQTGKDEIEISTGNRNYLGKQGPGNVYLASPATVAASLVSGKITSADNLDSSPVDVTVPKTPTFQPDLKKPSQSVPDTVVQGRVWLIDKDNIDTDMIFHNQYLHITDIEKMGQYTFDNLKGYEDFAEKAEPGDIVVAGKNFGCGSSRQQAVDCFKSLGISVIIAESFGAIYERNAINNAMPILVCEGITEKINDKDSVKLDFETGKIVDTTSNKTIQGKPFSPSQLAIYKKGGLLVK